jgi:hypothetical protein
MIYDHNERGGNHMKWTKWLCVLAFISIAVQNVWAVEGARAFQINNRIRGEYDDNVYAVQGDKTESFNFIEEVEFLINLNLEKTFLGLRYRPSFIWYSERDPDNEDFNNDLDLVLNQEFSPRLALSIIDTLRRGQLPDLLDQNNVVIRQEDFYYNSVNGTLGYLFTPATRLDLGGQYVLLKYDNDDIADTSDYDLYIGGLTLRQQLVPESTVLGEVRYQDIAYQGPNRDSQTVGVGAGLEQIFSPNLVGAVRGGYEEKNYDAEALDSSSSPFGDATLTFLPSPATRITAGVGYSLAVSDVEAYANQERTQAFASLAHDITARISWYLSGGYTKGDYDQNEAVTQGSGVAQSGTEESIQASTRITYKLNRSNWVEAGWQYVDLNSEIQPDYDRNRVDVGWKTQF